MKTTYFIEKENTKRRGETRRQLTKMKSRVGMQDIKTSFLLLSDCTFLCNVLALCTLHSFGGGGVGCVLMDVILFKRIIM